MGESLKTDLLIIGGGPGGYHAAFRAASRGIDTTVVDPEPGLGGVCLHRGCIPSKTYLHLAETIHAARSSDAMGVTFDEPKLDVDAIRSWKEGVVSKLLAGLAGQVKKHKVKHVTGTARFADAHHVVVTGGDAPRIEFRRAIIATGSRSIEPRGIMIDSPNVLTSRTALELEKIPETLLVLGGGYIGLELGQVYAAFGSKVTVVEMMPDLLPGVDRDLVRPLAKRLGEDCEEICLETSVTGMKEASGGIELTFDGKHPPKANRFDRVLVSVGRRPNSKDLDLDRAGVEVDERGFIKVDGCFRTTAPDVYAIGDVIGNPMLAHKAQHEGTILGEALASGEDAVFSPRAIPAVVFTDPAIAWAGLTQTQAKEQGLDVVVKKMPWGASGRATTMGRSDGVTKLICEKSSGKLLGIGLTGVHVGEMIAEGVLAIERGATAADLAATIHPHPTLSESVGETAALFGA